MEKKLSSRIRDNQLKWKISYLQFPATSGGGGQLQPAVAGSFKLHHGKQRDREIERKGKEEKKKNKKWTERERERETYGGLPQLMEVRSGSSSRRRGGRSLVGDWRGEKGKGFLKIELKWGRKKTEFVLWIY